MAVSPDVLQRSPLTTHKSVHEMLLIDRWFPMKSSFLTTTCPNNVVCLTHAGMLSWRFRVHCEMNKEQSRTVEEECDFYFFFSLLFLRMLKSRWPVTESNWSECQRRSRTGASASVFNLARPSKSQLISANRPLLLSRSGNDSEHFCFCQRIASVSTACTA